MNVIAVINIVSVMGFPLFMWTNDENRDNFTRNQVIVIVIRIVIVRSFVD